MSKVRKKDYLISKESQPSLLASQINAKWPSFHGRNSHLLIVVVNCPLHPQLFVHLAETPC